MLWTMYIVPTSPFEFGGVWQGRFGGPHTLLGHWDLIPENTSQRVLAHSIVVNSVRQARRARWVLRGCQKRFVGEVGALFVRNSR